MWQNLALILMGLGMLALTGWGVKVFFMASDIPLQVRIAVGPVGVGILILTGVAIKERRTKAKTADCEAVEK